jgi:broad specificity phosphatase PhoE
MLLASHAGQTVVAVAHDSFNRALLTQLLDLPLSGYWRIRQDPCCINIIEASERISVRSINSISHLTPLSQERPPNPSNVTIEGK